MSVNCKVIDVDYSWLEGAGYGPVPVTFRFTSEGPTVELSEWVNGGEIEYSDSHCRINQSEGLDIVEKLLGDVCPYGVMQSVSDNYFRSQG